MAAGGRSISALDCRSPTSTSASTALLGELGIDVDIFELPFGIPMKTPFPEDIEHASWDRDAVERFGRILDWSDSVFEEFSGWFNGKTSPVHLFWHGLDLAVTRFSAGRRAPLAADPVTQEAYSHEVISFGFWAGDDTIGDAAYYSYTAPEPEGLRDQPLPAGEWLEWGSGSLAVLRYDDRAHGARSATRIARLLRGDYEAGARRPWLGHGRIPGRAGAQPRLSFSISSAMRVPTWGGRPRDPDPAGGRRRADGHDGWIGAGWARVSSTHGWDG